MEKRVVVLDAGYGSYEPEEAVLQREGYSLEVYPGEPNDRHAKFAFGRGAAGAFIRGTEFDAEAFDAVPSVRYLVRYGVGYDNVDLGAASQRGVLVANVQGYANHSVSDHALAMIFACVRALPLASRDIRDRFGAPPRPYLPEIKDLTLGIVGLGRIGGTLCAKARSLFKGVWATDPYVPLERFAALSARPCDLDTLLSESDVISIHCNLSGETRLMFDAPVLARMRHNAILINTARGPIVDEEALLEVLERGRLHAAGLDVFRDEPPLSNRDALLAHPHVIATGHYAWFSNAAGLELQRRAAENMAAMLRGEIPEDCLNPDARGTV